MGQAYDWMEKRLWHYGNETKTKTEASRTLTPKSKTTSLRAGSGVQAGVTKTTTIELTKAGNEYMKALHTQPI